MAGWNLSINSRFNPLTYDEIVKPLLQLTELLNQYEDALGELNTLASLWENKANKETDPLAYALYKKYADDLRALASLLATYGLSPSSRQGILQMRARYASEITPLEEAYKRRLELADEQRKLRAKDDTLRFSTDYSLASLDSLINNPAASYESLSGNLIASRASAIASNYAKSIVLDPKFSKVMGGYYWQVRLQQGYTPELILAEAMNDPNAPKELLKIRLDIHLLVGANTAYDKAWVDSYISQGMTSAIGTAKYDFDRNYAQMTASEAASHTLAQERNELARLEFNAKYESDGKGGYKLRTSANLIPMEGGGSYDPATGTIRNEKGEIVTNPKGGAVSKITGGVLKENYLPFKQLDFTGGGFDRPGSTDEFSTSDAEIMDKTKLSSKLLLTLTDALLPYGLTIDDIDIYEDVDIFSKNHYRVVPKGYKATGEAPEQLDFE